MKKYRIKLFVIIAAALLLLREGFMLITPEYVFTDVTHITPQLLAEMGITGLALDVDNTLTLDRSQELPPEVAQWLADMKAAGVQLTIVSNGSTARVQPFAEQLGLLWTSRSAKPLTIGLRRARARMEVQRARMAMVGDQLLTDRMAAGLYGIPCFVVVPRGRDCGWWVRAKRVLEKPFWAAYYKRGGKLL